MTNHDKNVKNNILSPVIIGAIITGSCVIIAALINIYPLMTTSESDPLSLTAIPVDTQPANPTISHPTPTLKNTSVPPSQDLAPDISTILSNIVSGQGGIEKAAPWWKAVSTGSANGYYDPSIPPGSPGCYGIAWNVQGLDYTVVVFQESQNLEFQAGGFYAQICLENNVNLLPEDVGRIQATWLGKEYNGVWSVQILKAITSSKTSNLPDRICASEGMVVNHNTSDPLYQRPEGYTSGWITSDSSDILLPDGTTTNISERYVLLVENLPQIQIYNVALGPQHSNTWGCWYRSDLTDQVRLHAENELELMYKDAPSVGAGLYLIGSSGLRKVR